MAASSAQTSSMTMKTTATCALAANGCGAPTATSARRAAASTRTDRSAQQDCQDCTLRQRCTPNMPARKVTRSIHEGARDMARDIATTDAYLVSSRHRKKVEMLFAHLKRILKLDRLRLRGPNGAKDEFHRHSPEPPEAGKDDPDAEARPRLSGLASSLTFDPHSRSKTAEAHFFNRMGRKAVRSSGRLLPPSAAIAQCRCFRRSIGRTGLDRHRACWTAVLHSWTILLRVFATSASQTRPI